MQINKALRLPPSDLGLVQRILDEAVAMHAELSAIRAHTLDLLQFNLQQSEHDVLRHFGEAIDELLQFLFMPTDHLMVAIGVLREAGFDEEADLLQPSIFDRTQLIRAVPALEQRLRSKFDHTPSSSSSMLGDRSAAWRALEKLTQHARFC